MIWHQKIWHKTLRRPYKLVKSIDEGKGKQLLLIHGLGARGLVWQPFVNLINKSSWRTVAFDLLGFGDSPKPEFMEYTVDEHARSLLASLDKDFKKQKITIIGHSMGCLVASHIAWKHPQMIDRLILYEPPLFADSPEFRSHKRRRRLYFAFYGEILKRPQVFFAYNKFALRFAERWALGLNAETWPAFEKSLLNTIMNQKAYQELKNIGVPTDIIYGRFDLVVTRTEVKEMLKSNPNIHFHLVKEMHEITPRAARYLNQILELPPGAEPIRYTKRNVQR